MKMEARRRIWAHGTVTIAVSAAFATAWLVLGQNSDNVPWFPEWVWVLACGLAAGSAISVGVYQSLFALRSYTVIVAVIGLARSLAYLNNNSGGPAAVWFITTGTTILAYSLVEAKARTG